MPSTACGFIALSLFVNARPYETHITPPAFPCLPDSCARTDHEECNRARRLTEVYLHLILAQAVYHAPGRLVAFLGLDLPSKNSVDVPDNIGLRRTPPILLPCCSHRGGGDSHSPRPARLPPFLVVGLPHPNALTCD